MVLAATGEMMVTTTEEVFPIIMMAEDHTSIIITEEKYTWRKELFPEEIRITDSEITIHGTITTEVTAGEIQTTTMDSETANTEMVTTTIKVTEPKTTMAEEETMDSRITTITSHVLKLV